MTIDTHTGTGTPHAQAHQRKRKGCTQCNSILAVRFFFLIGAFLVLCAVDKSDNKRPWKTLNIDPLFVNGIIRVDKT